MISELENLDIIYSYFHYDDSDLDRVLSLKDAEIIVDKLNLSPLDKTNFLNKIQSLIESKSNFLKVRDEFLELFDSIQENLIQREDQ